MNDLQVSRKASRLVGVAVIVAMLLVQTGTLSAQSRSQNYNTVSRVGGTTAILFGIGAGVCGVLSAGACPAGLAIGGMVLGGVSGTLTLMGTPNGESGPMPGDMPDANTEDCGIECQSFDVYDSFGTEDFGGFSDDSVGYEYSVSFADLED